MKAKQSPVKPYINPAGVRAMSEWLDRESARQNLALHEVAENSNGMVRHQALYNIRNCKVNVIEERTLAGIAEGLSVSLDTVYDVYLLRQPLGEVKMEAREITLPRHIWEKLEATARHCQLPLNQQITAMIYHTAIGTVPTHATEKSPAFLPIVSSTDKETDPVITNETKSERHPKSPSRTHSNRGRNRHKGS